MVSDKALQKNEVEEMVELPDIPDPKSGPKTTEFYLTLLSYALAALVLYGVVTAAEAQAILDSLNTFVGAATGLIVALGPVASTVMYIYSRTKVKSGTTEAKAKLFDSMLK